MTESFPTAQSIGNLHPGRNDSGERAGEERERWVRILSNQIKQRVGMKSRTKQHIMYNNTL